MLVVAGVAVLFGCGDFAAAPLLVGADIAPVPGPLEPEAGVVAGVAGSEVSGAGSGGSGFDKIPAIISFRPASD